jgi:hypothetical protein
VGLSSRFFRLKSCIPIFHSPIAHCPLLISDLFLRCRLPILPVPAYGSAPSAGALSPAARLFRAGFSESRQTIFPPGAGAARLKRTEGLHGTRNIRSGF